jgi:hypothetical protein
MIGKSFHENTMSKNMDHIPTLLLEMFVPQTMEIRHSLRHTYGAKNETKCTSHACIPYVLPMHAFLMTT